MRHRVKITDKVLFRDLMKKTGIDNPTVLVNTGLTLLKWVVNKVEDGYSISAVREQGDLLEQFEFRMLFIDYVRERASERPNQARAATQGD